MSECVCSKNYEYVQQMKARVGFPVVMGRIRRDSDINEGKSDKHCSRTERERERDGAALTKLNQKDHSETTL